MDPSIDWIGLGRQKKWTHVQLWRLPVSCRIAYHVVTGFEPAVGNKYNNKNLQTVSFNVNIMVNLISDTEL